MRGKLPELDREATVPQEHDKNCPCRKVKDFLREGEDFAGIVHQGSAEGPQVINIRMDSFTPAQARRLASWLTQAAQAVTEHNARRKRASKQ